MALAVLHFSPTNSPRRNRRDSLGVHRKTLALSVRDEENQPVRTSTPGAKPTASKVPLLSGGAQRVPVPGAERAASGVATTPVKTTPARPSHSGTPLGLSALSGGARRVHTPGPAPVAANCVPACVFDETEEDFLAPRPGDPLALGTPSSAFRTGPLRVALDSPSAGSPVVAAAEPASDDEAGGAEFGGALGQAEAADDDETAGIASGPLRERTEVDAPSPARHALAAETAQGGAAGQGGTGQGGTFVRLEPVRADSATRARLGSSSVLTPVRRSARAPGPEQPLIDLLERTDYSYTPNRALRAEAAGALHVRCMSVTGYSSTPNRSLRAEAAGACVPARRESACWPSQVTLLGCRRAAMPPPLGPTTLRLFHPPQTRQTTSSSAVATRLQQPPPCSVRPMRPRRPIAPRRLQLAPVGGTPPSAGTGKGKETRPRGVTAAKRRREGTERRLRVARRVGPAPRERRVNLPEQPPPPAAPARRPPAAAAPPPLSRCLAHVAAGLVTGAPVS